MRRILAVLGTVLMVGGCSSGADPPSETDPTSPLTGATQSGSPSGTPTYEVSGCPVPDEAFCATAIEVIDALRSADVDRLIDLSREDRLVCAELAVEYFPMCEQDDVLEGYALGGSDFIIEVVDDDGYRSQLEAIIPNIDTSFSDELGDGSVRVIGLGTCGPNEPGRRTYHIAWTAAVGEAGAPAERLLGQLRADVRRRLADRALVPRTARGLGARPAAGATRARVLRGGPHTLADLSPTGTVASPDAATGCRM